MSRRRPRPVQEVAWMFGTTTQGKSMSLYFVPKRVGKYPALRSWEWELDEADIESLEDMIRCYRGEIER